MPHKHSDSYSSRFAIIAAMSAVVGVLIGSLTTARSGADNRAALAERGRAVLDRLKGSKEAVTERAEEIKEHAIETIKEVESEDNKPQSSPEKDMPEK